MKSASIIAMLVVTALCSQAKAQGSSIFPKGEIATVNNHTGTVWLKELNQPDSLLDIAIATATFVPGARLDWHGAARKSNFTYIAVSSSSAKNKTVWLQRVTDQEYNSAKQ